MAIFRKGKRIGNYDIRIGWPRDKSLDEVERDKRITSHVQGVTPESVMGNFISKVNMAEGFSRAGRFFVQFQLPRGGQFGLNTSNEYSISNNPRNMAQNEQLQQGEGTLMRDLQNRLHETVGLFCNKVTVPDRTLESTEVIHHGPARHFVHSHKYEPIVATFYADAWMRERMYFEAWQKAAISNDTHNVNFYDDYTTPIHIMGLGQYANTVASRPGQPDMAMNIIDKARNSRSPRSPNPLKDRTWDVQLLECYPISIGAPEMTAESNEIVQFDVTFTYRYWINGYIDQLGNLDYGKGAQDAPIIRSKSFRIPFLNKLPAELRRTGRDAFNQLKNKIPFGKLTRGIVFPPFS